MGLDTKADGKESIEQVSYLQKEMGINTEVGIEQEGSYAIQSPGRGNYLFPLKFEISLSLRKF